MKWKYLIFLGLSLFFLCNTIHEKKFGVAGTKLEVRKDPVSRTHIHYEGKPVAIISKGDTFEILKEDRDYDFFTFYKIKTKENIKGYLFEGDTFKLVEESGSLHRGAQPLDTTKN